MIVFYKARIPEGAPEKRNNSWSMKLWIAEKYVLSISAAVLLKFSFAMFLKGHFLYKL